MLAYQAGVSRLTKVVMRVAFGVFDQVSGSFKHLGTKLFFSAKRHVRGRRMAA